MELHGFAEVRTPILSRRRSSRAPPANQRDRREADVLADARRGVVHVTARRNAGRGARVSQQLGARQEPVTRWYYIGPMFRAERPQRGRQRQFYQAAVRFTATPPHRRRRDRRHAGRLVECARHFGSGGAGQLDRRPITRQKYRNALIEHLTPKKDSSASTRKGACSTTRCASWTRKIRANRAAVADAPSILDVLEPDDQAHGTAFVRLSTRSAPSTS